MSVVQLCTACKLPFGSQPFYQVEGLHLCSGCYSRMYTCPYCKALISGSYLPLNDQKWHPQCYEKSVEEKKKNSCVKCGKPFGTEQFFLLEGQHFCASCTSQTFICAGCGERITDAFIPVDQFKYHTKCYNKMQSNLFCADCKIAFGEKPYFEVDGRNLCEGCSQKALTCAKCGRVITGSFIPVGPFKYHIECHDVMVCVVCHRPISGDYLKLDGNVLHSACKFHYNKDLVVNRITGQVSTGKRCNKCGKDIVGEFVLDLNQKEFHPECFGTMQRGHHQKLGLSNQPVRR